MNQAIARTITGGDFFSANVHADGATVNIHATTLDSLLKTLRQFGYSDVLAADDTPAPVATPKKEAAAPKGKPAAAEPAPSSSTTPTAPEATAAPASTPSPEAPGKSESAAPAAAPSPASTKADAPVPDYAKVKDAVIALAKINRDLVVTTLGGFGVDHGSKLTPEQYAPFIEAANKAMAEQVAHA